MAQRPNGPVSPTKGDALQELKGFVIILRPRPEANEPLASEHHPSATVEMDGLASSASSYSYNPACQSLSAYPFIRLFFNSSR